jgi:hypothetical protein
MNKTLSTSLIVIAVLVLAGSIFFFGTVYGRASLYEPSLSLVPNGNARPFDWNNNSYGPRMMGGNGGYDMGPGMMQRGYAWNSRTNSNITPLTVDQSKQAAEKYVQTLNISGLEPGEVMIFDNNAYVVIKESETGLGAFELLIDPVSGVAYPEYGPNLMWNAKYGSLGHASMMNGNGMMIGMTLAPGASAGVRGNGWDVTVPANISSEMPVTSEKQSSTRRSTWM